jgi:anion-transporting  ArsA/GET3 family ATPase
LRSECLNTSEYEFQRNRAVILYNYFANEADQQQSELFDSSPAERKALKELAELETRYQFIDEEEALEVHREWAIQDEIDSFKVVAVIPAQQSEECEQFELFA